MKSPITILQIFAVFVRTILVTKYHSSFFCLLSSFFTHLPVFRNLLDRQILKPSLSISWFTVKSILLLLSWQIGSLSKVARPLTAELLAALSLQKNLFLTHLPGFCNLLDWQSFYRFSSAVIRHVQFTKLVNCQWSINKN